MSIGTIGSEGTAADEMLLSVQEAKPQKAAEASIMIISKCSPRSRVKKIVAARPFRLSRSNSRRYGPRFASYRHQQETESFVERDCSKKFKATPAPKYLYALYSSL